MQHVSQQASLAKVLGKPHDGLRQQAPHFAAGAKLFRIMRSAGNAGAQRLLARCYGLIEGGHSWVAALPQQSDGSVGGEEGNPRAERISGVITFSSAMSQTGPVL